MKDESLDLFSVLLWTMLTGAIAALQSGEFPRHDHTTASFACHTRPGSTVQVWSCTEKVESWFLAAGRERSGVTPLTPSGAKTTRSIAKFRLLVQWMNRVSEL